MFFRPFLFRLLVDRSTGKAAVVAAPVAGKAVVAGMFVPDLPAIRDIDHPLISRELLETHGSILTVDY